MRQTVCHIGRPSGGWDMIPLDDDRPVLLVITVQADYRDDDEEHFAEW